MRFSSWIPKLLGVQCLISLSDGLAMYTSPLYNASLSKNHRGFNRARAGVQIVLAMLNGRCSLQSSHPSPPSSFIIGDVVAVRTLPRAAGSRTTT